MVEGRDDRLFFERFTSEQKCAIDVATGKENVCSVIEILEKDNFHGVLGIVDADFDRLTNGAIRSENILMSENHDLITMLMCSPALYDVTREFGSRRKIQAFGGDVLDALICRGLPVGYLRLYSIREGLGLKFSNLSYSAWIDTKTFKADTSKLIEEVKNRSQRHDLSSSVIATEIEALHKCQFNPYEICNGTDLVAILSLGLRRALGNNNSSQVTMDILKKSLRLAYSIREFSLSKLWRDIQCWEK